MIKLAAVVILYHPPENVLENILSYYHSVERLYVFDNTETYSCQSLFNGLGKIIFIHNGENKGISKRLNEGCRMAATENFYWLLTMDQDSRFPENTLDLYRQCVEQYGEWQTTAVFGIEYEPHRMKLTAKCMAEQTPFIITSGMLVNISVFSELGDFDENLFIDAVDHEYCLRANQMGFKTVKFGNICLDHMVGALVHRAALKTLYLVKKWKHVHSPLRCYYLLRNTLYLAKKYEQQFPDIIAHNNIVVKMHLRRSFWYGEKAWKTYQYIRRAIKDFKSGRMGKINS